MKKLLIIILMLVSLSSFAQALVGVSGGSAVNNDFRFDFSIGEAVVLENANAETLVNIGFQQPWYDFFTGLSIQKNTEIKVFPNPFSGTIFIQSNIETKRFELFDGLGKKVSAGLISGLNSECKMENLPKGFFLIRIFLADGTSKEIKLIHQ